MRLFLIISLVCVCGITAKRRNKFAGMETRLDKIIDSNLFTAVDLTGGTCRQSSTTHEGEPARAIDDKADGLWGSAGCTHTANEAYPWWELTLPTSTCIYSVSILNRKDCCRERLAGAKIYISEDEPNHSTRDVGTLCQTVSNKDATLTSEIAYPCASPITGKYITIQHESEEARILTLCEVKVTRGKGCQNES
ncbi:fucolectin-like [Amphiura filiformis]|uniref:fucolectin-like n=1 Tax=Amphiura filiformis TaxID=82378 RepID=UPI003B226693